MKKSLLILFLLLMITGCGGKNINKDSNVNQDSVMVEINGEKFKLSSESNLKDLHYRENYVDFHTDAIGKMRTMQYSKNGEFIFEVRLIYDDDRTYEEAKQLINYEISEKKINDIKYEYYEYETDVRDKVHVYLNNYKNTTYIIMFILKDNMDEFENTYMNSVYFK